MKRLHVHVSVENLSQAIETPKAARCAPAKGGAQACC